MVTRKENLTEEEINKLSEEIQTVLSMKSPGNEDCCRAITNLGWINACAYKGYGELTENMAIFNQMIYGIKNKFLPPLTKCFVDNGLNVSYSPTCIYFRRTDGVQLSFHVECPEYYTEEQTKEYNRFSEWLNTLPVGEWDKVPFSYRYSAQEYEEKKQWIREKYVEWEEKIKSYQYRIKEEAKSYLKHHARRKRLGIEMSLDELNRCIDNADMAICSNYYSGLDTLLLNLDLKANAEEEIVKQIISKVGKAPDNFSSSLYM